MTNRGPYPGDLQDHGHTRSGDGGKFSTVQCVNPATNEDDLTRLDQAMMIGLLEAQ